MSDWHGSGTSDSPSWDGPFERRDTDDLMAPLPTLDDFSFTDSDAELLAMFVAAVHDDLAVVVALRNALFLSVEESAEMAQVLDAMGSAWEDGVEGVGVALVNQIVSFE